MSVVPDKWRTAALLFGSTLAIILVLFFVMLASGWRFQRTGRQAQAASGASAEKWSPPRPGEGMGSRLKRLAHDVSSLSIAPTNRPDPNKILNEAKSLADKGQYEEALQRHIWYHNHALEYDSGQTGVRLSFALSSWLDLGRKYPKAKEALVEIQDRGAKKLADGQGDFALFQEVSAINRVLQTEDDTVALFKRILKKDRDLASQCFWSAEQLLVQKGEYQLCLSFIPDADAWFDRNRQMWESTTKMSRPFSPPGVSPPRLDPRIQKMMDDQRARMQKYHDDRFIQETRNLVEILVATDHKAEAEAIRAKAVALMDDPRLASSVTDAEKKVAGTAKQ